MPVAISALLMDGYVTVPIVTGIALFRPVPT